MDFEKDMDLIENFDIDSLGAEGTQEEQVPELPQTVEEGNVLDKYIDTMKEDLAQASESDILDFIRKVLNG